MSHGNELPKIIDKTQADIDAAIATIQNSDIPASTKDFVISCIKLAVWLPKALLEHKIKLSNLRKLIFGLGHRNKKKSKNDAVKNEVKNADKENGNAKSTTEHETEITEVTQPFNQQTTKGHGRLPHSAYTNTIDHQILIVDLKSGDPCPMLCGGKVYDFEPGVMARVNRSFLRNPSLR